MVIGDLDIFGTLSRPSKADTVLVIDPDRVLASPILPQRLKPVSGRRSQVVQCLRGIQHEQLPPRDPLELPPRRVTGASVEEDLRRLRPEASDDRRS
jgi:hypothetical protein